MGIFIQCTARENDRHLKDVVTLLLHGGKLFSGGEDGIIKMWDLDLNLLSQVQAHEVNIYHLAALGDTLYTCSNDGTIKAWFVENLKFKTTLLKYDEEVYRLYVDSGKLYSGDNKGLIGVFENDRCQMMFNFIEEVQDMVVQGNLVYSVRDRDLVITELLSKSHRFMTRKTIEGSSPMAIVGTRLCFASRSGLDINIHENVKETGFKRLGMLENAHEMIILALCAGATENVLFSGGWDKQVKCWDIVKQTCTDSCDVGCCVNALSVSDMGQVYVAGANGLVCRLGSN